jgi:EmrB/QacA subfamily drug resistance transporter
MRATAKQRDSALEPARLLIGRLRGALAGRTVGPRLALVTACLALFVSTLDNTVANVALPQIGRSLHAGSVELQWVVDSYLVVRGCLLLSAGALSDRFGRRRTFVFGLGVFGVGSLLCSLAPTAELLIASRILQAVGGSFLVPSSLAMVADAYPDKARRARAIGVWGSTTALSTGLGPPIGGLLVVTLGWRSVFWINLPIVAVAAGLAAYGLPARSGDPTRRLDIAGQGWIAVALISVTLGFINSSAAGWLDPQVTCMFIVCAVALGGFLITELRVRHPLLSPRLFRSRPFSGAAVIATTGFIVYTGFLFINTLYLQEVRGYSALVAGLIVVPTTLGNLFVTPMAGRLTAKHGPRIPVMLACTNLSVGSAALSVLADHNAPIWALIASYMVVGSGAGMLNTPLTSAAMSGLPRERAGVAGAVTSTFRQVGNSVGVALLGALALGQIPESERSHFSGMETLGATTRNSVDHAFSVGLQHAYWAASALAVLSLAIAALYFKGSAFRLPVVSDHEVAARRRT